MCRDVISWAFGNSGAHIRGSRLHCWWEGVGRFW